MTVRVATPLGAAPAATLLPQGNPTLKADVNGNSMSAISGVPIVATAPTYTPGPADWNIVFCLADSKLHVHNGTAWVASAALA